MADSVQKLGIELSISLDSKFSDLIKQIESAFSKVDLKGFESKIAGVEGKIGKLAEEIEKKLSGADLSKIKTDLDTSKLNESMAKATKRQLEFKEIVESTHGQLVTQFSRYSAAVAAFNTVGFRQDLKETQQQARNSFQAIIDKSREASAAFVSSVKSHNASSNLKEDLKGIENSFADTLQKIRSDRKKIQDEINKAYSQKGSQDSAAAQAAKEADKAYASQDSLANKKLNLLNTLQKKEEAIAAAKEKADAAELQRTLRKIDQENAAFDRQQQTALRALARFKEQQQNAITRIVGNGSTSWAKDIATQSKQAEQYLRSLSKQGSKLFNGEVVPKTYITDINKATEAAYKFKAVLEARTLNSIGNAAPQWSNDIATQSKQAEQYLRSLGKQGFEYVNGEIVRVNATASKMGDIFSNMTKHLIEFYAIRKVLFTVGAEFQTAFHTITDFNQALHDTAAIANASNAELSKMSEAALQIATHSKFSATQVMESMKILAQAGVSAGDLPTVARTADFFATGTGSNPQDAAKVLTTAMNVWNISADKSARITNALTAALNVSKLEVSDLATSFNYLANQSALFDKSLEDTTALIATLANQGMEASTIGTSMSMFMSRLAAPTPKFKNLMKEYGIDPADVSPRLHSMVEIIKTFEDAVDRAGNKGVKVEHIFQGLEQRVGRGFATLVQAGSDKLELMTQRITNTNSAAVAWNESMKGFNAQLNILRSELVNTIQTLMGGFGGTLTKVRENIQDFIIGLRSAEGQAALFTTALAGSITLIMNLLVNHPIGLAITAMLSGVAYWISKVGESNNKLAKDIDNTTKSVSEAAAAYQRKSDALYTILGLVDKNKVAEDGSLKVTEENRKKINELINLYPDLFAQLRTKKLMYDSITEAIKAMNNERKKEIDSDLGKFNSSSVQLGILEQELEKAKLKKSVYTNGNTNKVDLATAILERDIKNLEQSVQLARSSQKTLQTTIAGYSGVSIERNSLGLLWANRTEEAETKPKKTPVPPMNPSADKEEAKRAKAEAKLAKKEGENATLHEIELRKIEIKRGEAKLAEAKENLKTNQDLLEYQKSATKLVEEKYKLMEEEDTLRINKEIAARSKGILKFKDNGSMAGIYTDPTVENQSKAAEIIREEQKRGQARLDALRKEREDEKQKDLAKIKGASIPDYRPTSERSEKNIDRDLRYSLEALNIQKDRVKTASEADALSVAAVEYQIVANKKKLDAYEIDIQALESKKTLSQSELQSLELIKDKEADIANLIALQVEKKKELADTSVSSNFNRGMDKGVVGMGSFKSNTEQFGLDTTSTALNGMVDVISDTIDKLAQLKWSWQDFATGLGNIMKDIAKELERYIAKMLVVWAVQKLVGLMGNTSTVTNSATGAEIVNTPTMTYDGGGFAEGGMVTGGIPGVDSVGIVAQQGEVVIKKPSVDSIGVDRLLYANEYGRLPKFANGGLVGGGSARSSSSDDGTPFVLQIVNLAQGSPLPDPGAQAVQIVNAINADIDRRGPTYKTIKGIIKGG